MSERSIDELDERDELYRLLPALYRLRDAEQGEPLRALLRVVGEQVRIVKEDVDRLWDDLFIETCQDWVIPYIGDLVGNVPLHEVVRGRRADVAKTIYYRRRKGTLPVLEELARDVTGWGASTVAFFELLGWTQHLNHLRAQPAPNPRRRDPNAVDRVGTVNLRNLDALDRLDGPFDVTAHTVDVRTIAQAEGWHNIRHVGFFLWRLENLPLLGVAARQAAPPNQHGYHVSPLGNPAPLFHNPEPELAEAGQASEVHLPGPIRPAAFHFHLQGYQDLTAALPPAARPPTTLYYGLGRSLRIVKDGAEVPPFDVICKDLRFWDRPPAGRVAVDVRRGRLTFPPGEEPIQSVAVDFSYGFSATIGGGPYDRRRRRAGEPAADGPDTIAEPGALDALIEVPAPGVVAIGDALALWNPAVHPRTVIQILDSRTYVENLAVDLRGAELVIQAANGQRPTLIGEIAVGDTVGEGRLELNGLLVEGGVTVAQGVRALRLAHCTLVPGRGLDESGELRRPNRPSVLVEPPSVRLRLELERTITGALRLPESMVGLAARDTIIDAATSGGLPRQVPVLSSGNLAPFPAIDPAARALLVTIGDEGPYRVALAGPPGGLAAARAGLESAIRAARPGSPAFAGAEVLAVGNRLVIVPGLAAAVRIGADGVDPLAASLRLVPADAETRYAVVGDRLTPFPPLGADAPAVAVTIGTVGPRVVALDPAPANLSQARARLQNALRGADPSPVFAAAQVAAVNDRLVVLAGAVAAPIAIGPAPGDAATAIELGFARDRPAIAAGAGRDEVGPPAVLERVTVFGAVRVRELTLASEVIFTARVVTARRQAGCVRFSHVPDGSRVPRRYRCQPDLALAARAGELGAPDLPLPPAEAALVRARVRPAFTSVHYGDPAYAQLRIGCAAEIRTGAEDGSEMGVFSSLRQPQREANLRLRLEEYLPFGLEAGLIYVT